jgi:1,2-phenylacetyl-CoA epoxidase PaaB subunit
MKPAFRACNGGSFGEYGEGYIRFSYANSLANPQQTEILAKPDARAALEQSAQVVLRNVQGLSQWLNRNSDAPVLFVSQF